MTDVMIDIETLSTTPNSLILTIGAIKFNRYKEIHDIKDLDTFYVRIDQNSCKKLKMDISKDTLNWWNLQSDDYKYEALLNKDRMNIKDGLLGLTKFINDTKYIWANSPNFDCIILENAYKLCKLDIPWKFYNLRDTRTVYDLGNVSLKTIGETKHHALFDCYNQILALNKAFKNLKII